MEVPAGVAKVAKKNCPKKKHKRVKQNPINILYIVVVLNISYFDFYFGRSEQVKN